MKHTFTFILTFAMGAFFTAQATILPVPGSYSTIQAAIDAAAEGDTILVDNGTYFENLNFRGKSIILASQFIFSDELSDIENTVIDGSEPSDPDSASCIIIAKDSVELSNDTIPAVIGFTITNGTGTVWEDEHGPGLWYREGGGILIQYAAPRIRFNRFINNDASDKQGIQSAGGGGIRCGDGNPEISNNIFMGNNARYGGGLVLNYSGAIIRNNIFAGNSGGQDYGGGGIWITGNDGMSRLRIVENNTIVNNSSTKEGGGLLLWATTISLRNNIIWGNTAPLGPQIKTKGFGSVTVEYCNVMGGYAGSGNIDAEPAFTDTAYIPAATSPCIDAGDSTEVYNDPENPLTPGEALYPARGEVRNDMGAYGGPGSHLLDGFLTVSTPSLVSYPDLRLGLYPNPATSIVTITFNATEAGKANATIHSINGEEVYQQMFAVIRGENTLTVPIETIPSGLYMVSLKNERLSVCGKLVVR